MSVDFPCRAAKEEARFAIESCISTPLRESRIKNRNPAWSLGQWHEINPDSSSDDEFTEKERDVLKIYNEALSNIPSLSSKWDEATKKEKGLCTEQVGEACRAVCGVLSIYATRYPAQYLKKIHEPFEKLSDRQNKES